MRKKWLGLALAVLSFSNLCAAENAANHFSFYGFLLPTFEVASSGVESFSQPNLTAYTAASNPVLGSSPTQARKGFHVSQSRFGFLGKAAGAQGRFEFDIIDFKKASPTTGALPRVRRAVIDMPVSEATTLHFGQDWDIVSPMAPHTFNYVGHYFESGDIGFMRIQLAATIDSGTWQHAFALGLPGNNNDPADQLLELGRIPTLAWRETIHLGKGQVGWSVLAAFLRFDRAMGDLHAAGALTAFGELIPNETLQLRMEAYVGRNTANLGMLGLAFGNKTATAVDEAGAYVTLRQSLGASAAVFAGVGGSWVLNPSSMLAAYVPAASPVLGNTGPGIEQNLTARVGYEHKLADALNFFAEVAALATRHHLAAADLANVSPNQSAVLGQTGMQFNF